jgi:hypothetical protein
MLDGVGTEALAREIGAIDDAGVLTQYGWAWVLEWSVGNRVPIDSRVLLDVCARAGTPWLKAAAIRAALMGEDRRGGDAHLSDADTENAVGDDDASQWLRSAVSRSIQGKAAADPDVDATLASQHRHSTDAELLLIALMIIDTERTRTAATQLVHLDWPGHDAVQAAVIERLSIVDPEVRTFWLSALGLQEAHPDDPVDDGF